jgi:hypothetical protein
MCAVFMVVTNILREQSLQMAFVHRDDVVQQGVCSAASLCLAKFQNAFEMNSMRTACNIVTGRDLCPRRVLANDTQCLDPFAPFLRRWRSSCELTSSNQRLASSKFFFRKEEFVASHKLTAGFDTLQELRAFNAEWETLGVFPEEIWPLPKRTFEFMLSGSDAVPLFDPATM